MFTGSWGHWAKQDRNEEKERERDGEIEVERETIGACFGLDALERLVYQVVGRRDGFFVHYICSHTTTKSLTRCVWTTSKV